MNLRNEFDTPASAIVLAEGAFGETAGKTANGTVLHSEIFDTEVVIDSSNSGATTADILETNSGKDVPIVSTMDEALELAPKADTLIIGVAPAGGNLPGEWVADIHDAIDAGCHIVSGLHVFLSEDPDWIERAEEAGVELYDVRKPPADDELRVGDGRINSIETPIVLTMGTDCAVGKRTTTFELYREAVRRGVDAGWVATGQTGIIVGAHAGTVIDRVPSDFAAGTVEDLICDVAEDHDIVFVEGQAALSHRAYSGVSLSILHGSCPDAVVLADDPDRTVRTHFEEFSVAGIENEMKIISDISDTEIAAISTWGDQEAVSDRYNIPAGNVLAESGPGRILDAVMGAIES